jgi:hypothetical protein
MTLFSINIRPGNAKHARCHCAKYLALTLQRVGLIRVYQYINNHRIPLWVAVRCTALLNHSQKNYKLMFTLEEATEHRLIKTYLERLFQVPFILVASPMAPSYGTSAAVVNPISRIPSKLMKSSSLERGDHALHDSLEVC